MRSDEELLARARSDPDAFAAFYRRHATGLLAYLARRLGDVELAADVCAETFAAALVSIDRYDARLAPPVAWLYGIARHKLLDAQRRGAAEDRARRRLGIPRLALSDEAIERIETAIGTTAQDALAELPPREAAAIRARVLLDHSYEEIAAAEKTSEANVRQRVARGLARLRSRLEGTLS
jgi:RNA polymerase sigma factor (sigma-70 family)